MTLCILRQMNIQYAELSDQSEENNSKTNNHKDNNSPKTSKQRRVRTSFRPRRDTRKRGHEYQFPGRVPLKKPSGVDFLQTSHEISKFPGCTCTQRSMTREIRWRSRSSNAKTHYRSSLTSVVFKRQISKKKNSIYLQISKPSSHDSKKATFLLP